MNGDYEYALKLGTATVGATAFSDDPAKKDDFFELLKQLNRFKATPTARIQSKSRARSAHRNSTLSIVHCQLITRVAFEVFIQAETPPFLGAFYVTNTVKIYSLRFHTAFVICLDILKSLSVLFALVLCLVLNSLNLVDTVDDRLPCLLESFHLDRG